MKSNHLSCIVLWSWTRTHVQQGRIQRVWTKPFGILLLEFQEPFKRCWYISTCTTNWNSQATSISFSSLLYISCHLTSKRVRWDLIRSKHVTLLWLLSTPGDEELWELVSANTIEFYHIYYIFMCSHFRLCGINAESVVYSF